MVPLKRTVKFKVGRTMKERMDESPAHVDKATGLLIEASASIGPKGSARSDGKGKPGRS